VDGSRPSALALPRTRRSRTCGLLASTAGGSLRRPWDVFPSRRRIRRRLGLIVAPQRLREWARYDLDALRAFILEAQIASARSTPTSFPLSFRALGAGPRPRSRRLSPRRSDAARLDPLAHRSKALERNEFGPMPRFLRDRKRPPAAFSSTTGCTSSEQPRRSAAPPFAEPRPEGRSPPWSTDLLSFRRYGLVITGRIRRSPLRLYSKR